MALLLLYLGAAWGLSRITISAENNSQPAITIYLKSNGVHTDIVLPVKTDIKDWSQSILYKNTRNADTTLKYLAMGWGDKGFYLETPTWNDLKASTAFKAAFGLSSSAIHATFYHELREGEQCVKLTIAKEQYQRLVAFIENSLQTDPLGNPIVITTDARYGNNDAFYEASGNYSLFHTCNTWTNNALKASGQKLAGGRPLTRVYFTNTRNANSMF